MYKHHQRVSPCAAHCASCRRTLSSRRRRYTAIHTIYYPGSLILLRYERLKIQELKSREQKSGKHPKYEIQTRNKRSKNIRRKYETSFSFMLHVFTIHVCIKMKSDHFLYRKSSLIFTESTSVCWCIARK